MLNSGMHWVVIGAGVAAIVWVNWYFFVAGRSPAAVAERHEHASRGARRDGARRGP